MTENTGGSTSQYLTFTLDQEHYAVDIGKVREVLEFTSLTRIPRTPSFMRGMINLRGRVVPVIDLRLKFGLSKTEKTVDTCVIITEVPLDGAPTVLGALADSVQEVIELDAGQIEPPPKMGTRIDTDFILGMGKRDDSFLIILDIEKVLTEEEVRAAVQSQGSPHAQESGAPAA